MSGQMDKAKVKIPKLMQHLELDPRGYPIPVTVLRDSNNRPHFTINDSAVRLRLIIDDRCPICGNPLPTRKWFVGGPLSAFHEDGSYIDPAMHYECMVYALRVCPYLAAPNYSKRIDAATLKEDISPMVLIDNTVIPTRPEVFVAVECSAYQMRIGATEIYLKPRRPYHSVQYWKHGKRVKST